MLCIKTEVSIHKLRESKWSYLNSNKFFLINKLYFFKVLFSSYMLWSIISQSCLVAIIVILVAVIDKTSVDMKQRRNYKTLDDNYGKVYGNNCLSKENRNARYSWERKKFSMKFSFPDLINEGWLLKAIFKIQPVLMCWLISISTISINYQLFKLQCFHLTRRWEYSQWKIHDAQYHSFF